MKKRVNNYYIAAFGELWYNMLTMQEKDPEQLRQEQYDQITEALGEDGDIEVGLIGFCFGRMVEIRRAEQAGKEATDAENAIAYLRDVALPKQRDMVYRALCRVGLEELGPVFDEAMRDLLPTQGEES